MSVYYQDESVTLYHGDCREITDWLAADVLVTDPPYGLETLAGMYGRVNNHKGRTISNDGDASVRDLILERWADRPAAVFGSPRLSEPPGEWTDRLVWDKREPGINGGAWRYTHESIFVRGDGWKRQGANSFSILSYPSGNGTPEKAQHPHAKPVKLLQAILLSAPEGSIADPFSGIGSGLVAAKNLGRKAVGVELEEAYCEVIAKRLSQEVMDFTPRPSRACDVCGSKSDMHDGPAHDRHALGMFAS